MADRLVHLHDRLLRREDDRRPAGGALVGAEQRDGLLADARRLCVEVQSLDELPAALGADAGVLARVAPDLGDVVGARVRVDAAAAFEEVLLDRGAVGGDEELVLALGANHRQGHLHLGQAHALLGAQAEVDLLRERHVEGVALERRPVVAALRVDRRERGLVPAGRRLRERRRPQRRFSCGRLVQPAFAGESPRAVDEDADADALALGVAQVVDLEVLRDDVLAPKSDRARVGIRGPGPQCCIDRCLGQRLHAVSLTVATLAVARWWRNW